MVKCSHCGNEAGNMNFCPTCGQKIIKEEFSKSEETLNEKSLFDGIIESDDKISSKIGSLFSKSKTRNVILDKTASFGYKNIAKSVNNESDRKYYQKIEPVFLEVLDSIDDDFVKAILLYQRSVMGSSGSVVGVFAAQKYTPTKNLSHDDAIKFYQNMVIEIVSEINEEKQKGSFDEEEFYKKKVKQLSSENISVLGLPKSIKSYKKNQN